MGRRGTDPGERSSAAGEAADRSPHRRPTLEDVALLAGVSRGTVSRVVNDEPYVSAQARARVAQAIRDSGYVTHQAARSLVTWRTNSAAFVVSEPPRQFFEDPNIGTMFLGANGVLAPTRMQLVSVLVTNDEDRAKISRYVRSGHVDGVLLVSFSHDDPLVAEFARAGIPAAMVGRPSQGLAIPYVDVDADPGVRQIVRHLEAAGCRRIGTITAPLDRPPGTERLEAFRRARGRRFRRSLVVPGDFTRRSGELAMERLLELDPGIDGVFAASDLMAAAASAGSPTTCASEGSTTRGWRWRRARRSPRSTHRSSGSGPSWRSCCWMRSTGPGG